MMERGDRRPYGLMSDNGAKYDAFACAGTKRNTTAGPQENIGWTPSTDRQCRREAIAAEEWKKENGGQDASGPNSRETLSQYLEQLFAVMAMPRGGLRRRRPITRNTGSKRRSGDGRAPECHWYSRLAQGPVWESTVPT